MESEGRPDSACSLERDRQALLKLVALQFERSASPYYTSWDIHCVDEPSFGLGVTRGNSSLGDSKEKAGVVEFWGVGLSSGKGYTLKVQKESSSGVLSGGVIELVGTLTPSSGSESGRFSHTEEIFGVSAARISYGSSYAIVGIVVGGVEGVVNKKVGFSVPDEPCRLTKMTGSEFTDAEKTKMELSFETHALSANTDYSMVVESIVGEGETVHEKTLVLRTNTNGKIEPISVKLYPREDDATKLKGQLEFGTRYYVKRIEEGSTEIHIETAASTFLTPEEPIRIEGADSSLGDSKEKAGVVEFWGVGLSSGKGYTLKVQKESSSGVLSGGVIELVGTLTPSSGSESGRFSHTEEIFGVSAARISYGSSYAIVGIVVGGVEGVVNKKVGFSVPDEPCRLTKMTGSEFTDAEKTKMELSFETHALSANTDYSMVVESIVGEGETVHEKTLVLRTNTNGKIEPISVKLYPREDDATKLKGQLEFGTRYYVKRIEEGSTEIHIETAASTFNTPDEPARIEDCVFRHLNKDRTTLTLVLTGQLLTSTQLSVYFSNGSSVWIPLTPMAIVNDTHCSVEFPVGKDENTSTLAFGKKYTLQRDGGSAHFVVMSGIVVSVPNPPSLHDIHFSFANDLNTSCVVEVAGSDLLPSTEYNVTLNSTLFVIVHFSSSTKGMSGETQIGWEGGLQFVTEYTVTSIQPLNEDDGDILLLETVSGETGKRPSSFNIFTDSSSLEESPFCGDLERACSSISEVWKIVSGLVIVRPTIEIVDSVRMKEGIRIVGGMHVVIRNGTSSEPSLIVPSSFSLDSLSAVIVVDASGFLELRNVDVWLESSDPSFVFISATQATIILREGIITGPKSSPTQNEEETEDVCSWTSGVLQLSTDL
ncbi:hypothetical protein BLNAU_21191 [Blattamonas nauphoetae]|uniref:Uncharacterized protein n=1 Tax=Blattamonas nauphoetae TaxID=2049346 RepID=A0ABQ9WX47_9EUKA|nr:hypothetical protein BLNAU_21191 [Blattamonas nauphoetae]